MSRPTTDPPTWATSATAEITEPPSQRKTTGWTSGLIPPAGYWNWWMELVGEWLTFLKTAPPVYTDLGEAALDSAQGDVVIVDEHNGWTPGGSYANYETPGKAAGNDLTDIATYGPYLVIFEDGAGAAYRVARSDPATTVTTYTKTQAGTNRRVISDGVYVLLAYGNFIECFDVDGSQMWSYDHGGSVKDLCFYRNYVVFVADPGTGGFTARRLQIDGGGTSDASFDHGNTLYACTASGSRVYVAGLHSTYASNASLRCLTPTLYDATGEGGVGSSSQAWDVDQATIQDEAGSLVTDDDHLYLGYAETAPVQLEVRSLSDGQVLADRVLTNFKVVKLAVDQDYLVAAMWDTAAGNQGQFAAFSKSMLGKVWYYDSIGATVVYAIATDGCAVWGGISIPAGTRSFYRVYRGNRQTVFRRMDYSDSVTGDYYTPHGLRRLLVADRR